MELCKPAEGMSIYDPTVGSGGMLTLISRVIAIV
ncbi:MAG: hypothetical protein AAFR62_04515 [Cyanobacteria bacterium J06629_2]